MREITVEITEEEYLSMKDKTPGEINDFIESKLSVSILMGYGFYGGRLIKTEEKYYMQYKIGSTCD